MKRVLALAAFCAFSCGLYAQVVDTTVCEVLKNPKSFDGKMVRIKGTIGSGFDQFVIKGASCGQYVDAIWLAYPEGSKAKSGAVAVVEMQPAKNFAGTVAAVTRTPVTLEKNKEFKQFDSLLAAPRKGGAMCLGCGRYEVSATLVGRLDGVSDASLRRDGTGKIIGLGGFGNLNGYAARLVVQSVSDVTSKEIDYSNTDAATKIDTPSAGGPEAVVPSEEPDPVAQAHKAAHALPAGSTFAAQIEGAVAVYGKKGEENGVILSFGPTNEASPKFDVQGTTDSPDGVLYACDFNKNRLEGDALSRAVVHIGQHVADVRSPEKGGERAVLYELEFRGWMTTVVDSAISGQKTLTLPGSYLLWNTAWSTEDRSKLVDENLRKFLSTEELLSR
jgi:hypothetical protein